MKRYEVCVPLCAVERIEIEAESEEEAIAIVYEQVKNDRSLDYDTESLDSCWADEI